MSTLSTLSVSNLIFTGVHGETGRERTDPQRFKVDLEINLDTSKSAVTDKLKDTYDYKYAIGAAKQVIEEESHVLIETIASRIAEKVLTDSIIDSVQVGVSKLNAISNGIPSIRVRAKRSPQELLLELLDFDATELVSVLERDGGISIPILSDNYRKKLLEEAESYTYEKQPEIVGPAKVREQLSSTTKFRENSLFHDLTLNFERLLDRKLRGRKDVFTAELKFNEPSLQLYDAGSIGITPHMDGMSCINLICVFILTGKAKFALCKNREGDEPQYLDTSPGNVIIMRAPGFLGSDYRPFHFLSDVTERRIVFGLRQNTKKS